MSFFTNDAYASFRQPPSSLAAFQKPAHALPENGSHGLHRRQANASFASTASSASMLSELDPLSPINLQRAADPWHGNTLATASASRTSTSTTTTSSSSSSNSSSGSAAPPSLVPQVFVGDELDEEWGDFVNGGPVSASFVSETVATRNAKDRYDDHGGRSGMATAGWSRLPPGGYGNGNEPTSLFDEDDDLNDGSFLPFHARARPPQPQQQQAPSFAKTLLTRLASLGSMTSSPAASRRGSVGSLSLPPRNYDVYDVTFEKGPIGLELETDWYGRQAVVKGFKKVNDADGPARACGLIRVGDVLTAIDGESCLEWGFQETLARLRRVSAGKHALQFKSLEAAGDLSVYNQDADIIRAKKFIHQHKEHFYRAPVPSPSRQLILGCVERLRGEKLTSFHLHREDTGAFVLACSCASDGRGEFVFHTLQDAHLRDWRDLPVGEDSAVFLGRLVPNFLGTEFTLLDHQQKRQNELGFIEYSTNVLGRVPNFLKVVFPKQPHVPVDGEAAHGQDADEETRATTAVASGMGSNNAVFNTSMMDRNGTISERYKRLKQTRSLSLVEKLRSLSLDDIEVDLDFGGGTGGSMATTLAAAWHDEDDHASRARAMRVKQLRTRGAAPRRDTLTPYGAVEQQDFDCDLVAFETRKPSWNDELGAWTLNFQGRVKLASKKNFLVVAEQGNDAMEAEFGEDTTYLRFGKVASSRFSLDYQAPLSPLLALALACSAFAHKIAVT